jgi:serine/threonine-protein kinase
MSMPDTSVAPVREGEVLDGKYRVDKVLGVGGMGVVVAATHVHLHTKVALKFLLPSALASVQVIERFAREARAAVQIQSEHVARVSDVGTLPTGSPYMVMEFLEGGDLADVISKSGPLPVETAVGYVLQASEAIAEAHSRGIVHRDLKPANLFLAKRHGRDPIIKVLDFGISKMTDPSGAMTGTTAIMGSPFYMAPEQMMSSKDVDARSDIWALGVILYELLTAIAPFGADTMAEVVFRVTQRDPEPLSQKRPDVPQGLSAVISRCLAKDRAHRFQNVAEFVAAIAPFGPPRSEVSVERVSRLLGTDPGPPVPRVSNPMITPGVQTGGSMGSPPTSATWSKSQSGAEPAQADVVPRSKAPLFIGVGAAVAVVAVALVGWGMRGGKPASGSEFPSAAIQASTPPPISTPAASSSPPVVTLAAETTAPSTPAPAPSTTFAPTVGPAPTRVSPTRTAPHAAPAQAAHAAPEQPAAPAPASPPPPQSTNKLNMGMKE